MTSTLEPRQCADPALDGGMIPDAKWSARQLSRRVQADVCTPLPAKDRRSSEPVTVNWHPTRRCLLDVTPLITAAKQRHELTRAKAIRAINELDRAGAAITFGTVARTAHVSRS
jgi:hypothetical protein